MIYNKKMHDAEKQISKEKNYIRGSDGDAVINIKVSKKEQIFSSYNYDSNEKLNGELSEFIFEKARHIPVNKDLRIKFYTEEDIDERELKDSIQKNFKKEYLDNKVDMRRNIFFALTMLIFGLVSLTILVLFHHFAENIYSDLVLEIATWVFIWEAFDAYFLKSGELRRKKRVVLKIYTAEISVVKLKQV